MQNPAAFALASLTPIAKLTLGLSSALFVAQDSPIRSWQDFVTAAKERPFMISHGWCLGMALMEAHLGVSLKAHMMMGAMMMEDRASIVEAVESREADAGLFITRSLLPPPPGTAPLPIRVLGTFGAERHPSCLRRRPSASSSATRRPISPTPLPCSALPVCLPRRRRP